MATLPSNYMCQVDGKQATAFCFNGTSKETLCDEHVSSHFKKGMMAFPLEAIDFMQRIDDYPAFNLANERVSHGLCSIQIYREGLKSELQTALESVESVKLAIVQVVEEALEKVRNRLQTLIVTREKELSVLETELLEYRRCRPRELTEAARVLCQGVSFPPPLVKFANWTSLIDIAKSAIATCSVEQRSVTELVGLGRNGTEGMVGTYIDTINRLRKSGGLQQLAEANSLVTYFTARCEQVSDKTRLAPYIASLNAVKLLLDDLTRQQQLELSMFLAETRSQFSLEALCSAYRKLSESHLSSDQLDRARDSALKSVSLVQASKLKSAEAINVYLQYALVLKYQRNYPEAEKYLSLALDMTREDSGSPEEARCLRRFGDLFEEVEKFEMAEKSYKEALKIYETFHPDDLEVCTTLINLGIYYENRERLEDAADAWTRAVNHAESHGDIESAKQVKEYLAGVHAKLSTMKSVNRRNQQK